jgi:hypothetical protein
MKGIKPIVVSRKRALVEYKACLEALKKKHNKDLEDLKKMYYSIIKGKKIIDVYQAFKFAGINEQAEPKLAIVKADAKIVYFNKNLNGAGEFTAKRWGGGYKDNVSLPESTFCVNWKDNKGNLASDSWNIANRMLETKVPIIPPQKMPKVDLRNYYIMFEVDDWKVVTKDPILLKRVTKNLFIVIEKWSLTKLEQALIRGR